MAEEKEIGVVLHYFGDIGVAAIELAGKLVVGDSIHIKGHTSDFTCAVDSMQVDRDTIQKAKKGKSTGVKVPEHARGCCSVN